MLPTFFQILPFCRVFWTNFGWHLQVRKDYISIVLSLVKVHSDCEYEGLIDIVAIDTLLFSFPYSKRFSVKYILLSCLYQSRIILSVGVGQTERIYSSSSIFSRADWSEREIWDLFGVYFVGHLDLRRLLTDYGFRGHPLLKDYPLRGFKEVIYSERLKRVTFLPVQLTQGFRQFYIDNFCGVLLLSFYMVLSSDRHSFVSLGRNHLVSYPSPINIRYLWGFGSLRGFVLVIQILTGIFLAMHYTPHIDYAFFRIEHIIRDVNFGWLLRYIHANGARFFFILVYIHIFRGLYYSSYAYPRGYLWQSGVLILIAIIATGFIGYVLPWGQIRFWGATVITNLFSAIPNIGVPFVQWVWGGFSVDNATLNRFFSLHYLLPFLIVGIVFLHLTLLHLDGSSNPLGVDSAVSKIYFFPYFYVKDLFGFILLLIIISFFVFFAPNVLGHPDNYIYANPMVTPSHIVPEWYFLPFYAILRSIPHKLGGVIAMGGALVGLLFLPYLSNSEIRSSTFRPVFQFFFWFFFVDCFVLGWVGQKAVETPFVEVGQLGTLFYFWFLFFCIPFAGKFERYLIRVLFLLF
jgi:quinol-cytochrome oxidoreductase complex cytochrome b subunit/NADH:ubiquinone oxidoreductase subunit C